MTSSDDPVIELKHVSKQFRDGGEPALSNVTFTLPSASFTFLTGHSGAGKSTLLRLLLRLERPTRGQVSVNGQDLLSMNRAEVLQYRQQVGAVFQDPHLLSNRNVLDNVALPLLIAGYRRQYRQRRAQAALEMVGLAGCEKMPLDQLSTGQRQRVGIARAMVNRPRVLLANEPTGNLDPDLSREIMELLHRFLEARTTVLIASHDIELIMKFDAQVLLLDQGKLKQDLAALS